MASLKVTETSAPETTEPIKLKDYLISAAIDIGTSSSCYAFSYYTHPKDIKMNKNWAGVDTFQSYKTPTSILTSPGPDGHLIALGYEADEKYRTFMEEDRGQECSLYTDFKMKLYREKHISKNDIMVASKSKTTKRPLMDLYVMTLEYLSTHMFKAIKQAGCPLEPNRVRWVLCVPAIWTEDAKDFIRKAAYKAKLIPDFQSPNLILLLESTAAALYCSLRDPEFAQQHGNTDEAMKEGTQYLVIDAGAGTVDYTAQQVLPEEQTKEIMVANGGDWGGGHVNKRFRGLLEKVFGKDTLDDYAEKHPLGMYNMEQNFELQKSKVDDKMKSLNVSLPFNFGMFMTEKGIDNLPKVINSNTGKHGCSFNNGLLRISKEKIIELFDPSINEICSMAKHEIDSNSLNELRWIFLVGGFGACKLLQTPMIKLFGDDKIVIPLEAQTAVVKGAVFYGHNPNILIRVARKTYGVSTYSSFDPKKHKVEKKRIMGTTEICADLFLPFVLKGHTLSPGTHGEMIANPINAKATHITVDFFCVDRRILPDETLYVDSEGVEKVGSVRVEMPNTDGGLNREVSLKFKFNDEIQIEAFDKSSGIPTKKVTITFDHETTEI